MAARIVMDIGDGPVVGSITLDGADVGTEVALSNQDNTGVAGWRWEILDADENSPTLYPLPAATFGSTWAVAPDVKGHTVLVRLTTYLDSTRTQIDGVDQKVIRVRFDPPFDWVIPAAGESIEANEIRGWASDVNRLLTDLWEFIDAGGGGGGGAPQYDVAFITGASAVNFGVTVCSAAAPGDAYAATLPTLVSGDAGKVVILKIFDNSPAVTATPAGGQPIDGEASRLVSAAKAALTLVAYEYLGSFGWFVTGEN